MAKPDPQSGFVPTPAHAHALARRSFGYFARGAFKALHPGTDIQWAPYLDLIASKIEDVLAGRCRRLIICIPPRYGKSLMASVALPAYLLGRRPDAEFVGASYSGDLSGKMGLKTLQLMRTPFYLDVFGDILASSREAKKDFSTRQNGSRFSTSVQGTFTGRGGNVIAIDDPLKPGDHESVVMREGANEWFDTTVVSRPNNKKTDAIIVIMQRLHEDDLVGHLLAQGGWELLSLPAIAEQDEVYEYRDAFGRLTTWHRKEGEALHPARESLEVLADTRSRMSARDFAAQFQQRPSPAGGADILEEWFPRYKPQDLPPIVRKIQAWDTASKDGERNDFSACATIGQGSDGNYYVLDLFRARFKYPPLKQKVRELADLHQVSTVLVEDTSSGIALIQEFRSEGFTRIEAVKATGTKYERIMTRTGMMQAGKVWLPEQAHWVAGFLHEAVMFPVGTHDDQLDALAHGLTYLADTNSPARWLAMMDDLLGKNGSTPVSGPDEKSDRCVRFDHPDPREEFKVPSGRWLKREADGFYHATREEWHGLQHRPGIRLVFHPEQL